MEGQVLKNRLAVMQLPHDDIVLRRLFSYTSKPSVRGLIRAWKRTAPQFRGYHGQA